MKTTINRSFIKTLMMPVAMLVGAIFYPWMGYVTFLSPYLIFLMLFITYSKLSIKDFKPGKFEIILLCIQLFLAGIAYTIFYFFNRTLAEGLFICFLIPTATAAPVITAMLGGSISKVATYSLLSNLMIAIVGPLVLAAIGEHPEITFGVSFLMILKQVFPLILLPLVLALLIRKFLPKVHGYVVAQQQISFYLWCIALIIVVGGSVSFAIKSWTPESAWIMIWLAIGALVSCLIQFKIGQKVGKYFGDPISGGQSLGQKNTVLAIWISLAYLNPISSLAPASYVAWQNIVNSWQLMRKQSRQNQLSSEVEPI